MIDDIAIHVFLFGSCILFVWARRKAIGVIWTWREYWRVRRTEGIVAADRWFR